MGTHFLLVAAVASSVFANEDYLPSIDGMQGLSISCENEKNVAFILKYQDHRGFDFLKVTRFPCNIQVLVAADQVSNFKKQLKFRHIKYDVYIKDFKELVLEESRAQEESEESEEEEGDELIYRSTSNFTRTYSFNNFPSYVRINQYLQDISLKLDDFTLFNIGSSYEGREIYGIKISRGGIRKKPAILIDAGIHAREWMAPTTALFAISELSKKRNKRLYKDVDWYIIPLLNPDGYEYSRKNSETRTWRKTRSITSNKNCTGVDANRNFDYHWMEVGASENPCSETYGGSGAFSEIETRNLRDFVLSKNENIKIYISLHSYGQVLLHPWGYTHQLPKNEPTLLKIGEKAVKALSALHGTKYRVGSSNRLYYPAAGGSDDWVMAVGGADVAYTMELPGSSFIIPPYMIKPVGLETFNAFKVFAEYAANTYKDF